MAGMVLVAPNATQAISLFLRKTPAPKASHERILAELKRQGLVYISKDDDKIHFNLTNKGARRLQNLVISEIRIPIPKKWDKKWRVVTFDVPVKFNRSRQYFTAHLQSIGFFRLQKSLWIYPFPCFAELEQIAGHYNLLRYCDLFEITKMNELSTRRLLRHFNQLLPA